MDCGPPPGESDSHQYSDSIKAVFSFNPSITPQPLPVDDVFGGELMALCQETQREERHPSIPSSGVLSSALRFTGGVMEGVAHSPLTEAGRAREGAQRWGTYMSLTSPPLRQFKPEYYRIHYPAEAPAAEVLQPQQLWTTSSFLAIAKGAPPTEFRIRNSLLRDWEGLERASLGVINHLDWFLSTVWKMVSTVEVEPQMRTDINNMLTSSSVAVNQLAHMQTRLLAGNAAFRREGLLDASVLDRAGALFLRSQPIGGTDLFGGKVPEALRVAAEDRNKQLLFQAAVKPAAKGAAAPPEAPLTHSHSRGVASGNGKGRLEPRHRRPTSGLNIKVLFPGRCRGEEVPSWASRPRGPTSRRFDGLRLPNPAKVGARLMSFAQEWDALTTDLYVRSIVRDGYRWELLSPPPLVTVPIPMNLFRDTEHSRSLCREITTLLDKRAIEELDPQSLSPGFYSRIFLVPKTDGSYRPVFDLKSLNHFVQKEKFKMTTPRTVTNAMHKGDWAVSIDLKDAYFHVPIHVRSRRLLRFAVATNDGLPRFSIQSPPVRSDLCPTGVYQGNSSGGAPCASTRCLPSSVPRRLATKKSKQVAVGSANKLVARHHSSCGVCAKRAQVTISSHSTSDTHRCRISSRPRSDVPTDEPCSKVRRQDRNTAISVGHDSLFSAVPPRTVELSDRCNSTRQVASQTSATIFADPLVSF